MTLISVRKPIKLYLIYGYETKDTKISERDIILTTHDYNEFSTVMNALLLLQEAEDKAMDHLDPKDGYALVESYLKELVVLGIENVVGYFKFKSETYTIG